MQRINWAFVSKVAPGPSVSNCDLVGLGQGLWQEMRGGWFSYRGVQRWYHKKACSGKINVNLLTRHSRLSFNSLSSSVLFFTSFQLAVLPAKHIQPQSQFFPLLMLFLLFLEFSTSLPPWIHSFLDKCSASFKAQFKVYSHENSTTLSHTDFSSHVYSGECYMTWFNIYILS